ncbi:MAG TPA: MFS transporter, partial [Anaeromyxobacteraceae bacterium]|nr:MFS transporter [Anaeromyxobacteraceae bacterium]
MGFSAVSVGVFMATLDGSIVNVALPAIRRHFGSSIGATQAIVTVYLLVLSATLLAAGRLGDVLGRRRVFTGGMLLFTLGSGLCGFSWSLPVLVLSRGVQALGAAAMMAMGPAVITAIFPRERRGQALGAVSSVVAAGLTAGAPVGGAILAVASWNGIFLVNLPVGVAGAIWASRVLPDERPERRPAVDWPGAAFLGVSLAAGIGALDLAPHMGRAALGLLAVAVVGAVLLWRVERRQPMPLLDPEVLGDRTVSLALAAAVLSYASLFHQTLLSPFFLTEVKGLGQSELAAALTVVPISLMLASPVSGWFSDRFGPRPPQVVGGLLLAAGLAWLASAGPDTPMPLFVAGLVLEGFGMGFFQPPNNSVVMGALPTPKLGSGGGLLATSRNVGMVLGVASGGALFQLGERGSFVAGWRLALGAGAAMALAAGLLALVKPDRLRGPG